jgi:hypothetical protein
MEKHPYNPRAKRFLSLAGVSPESRPFEPEFRNIGAA